MSINGIALRNRITSISSHNEDLGALIHLHDFPAPSRAIRPIGLTAVERLSSPFEVYLDLRPGRTLTFNFDAFAESVIGEAVGVSLKPSDHSSDVERYFHGEIAGVYLNESADDRGVPNVVVELRPGLWKLAKTADTRYFTSKTTREIVSSILDDHGLAGRYQWHSTPGERQKKRDHCWQYREVNLQFVHRLLEEDGYQYWFTFRRTGHMLHIATRPESLPHVTRSPLKIGPIGPDADGGGRVACLRRSYTSAPASYFVAGRSADGISSVASAVSVHQVGAVGAIYDYDGLAHSVTESKDSAERRLASCRAGSQTADGQSDFRGVSAGCIFEIEGRSRGKRTRKYRTMMVRHEANQRTGIYSNRFEAVPNDSPFSQRRRFVKPAVAGAVAATVVAGPDALGRYRLQFDLDRTATRSGFVPLTRETDQLILPKKGHRVQVMFLEGDLDRPQIGRLLDPATRWPFDPAANPHLGGFVTPKHELLLQSDPSEPWIKLLSAGDIEDIAEGARHIESHKHRQEHVTGDAIWQIDGDAHWNVGGNWAAQLAKHFGMSAETIVLRAAKSIAFVVGSNFIVIDANGITINGLPMLSLNPPGASTSSTPVPPKKPAISQRRSPKPGKTKKR